MGAVRDIDKGAAALMKRLLSKAEVTVGIHAPEGDQDKEDSPGQSILDVAECHELGLGVPRRSFIADWADENKERHEAQLSTMAKAVAAGKVESAELGVKRLGVLYVGEVQKRIADGIEPPLEQATIERKGSSVPLIETGQMRGAVAPYVNGKPIK